MLIHMGQVFALMQRQTATLQFGRVTESTANVVHWAAHTPGALPVFLAKAAPVEFIQTSVLSVGAKDVLAAGHFLAKVQTLVCQIIWRRCWSFCGSGRQGCRQSWLLNGVPDILDKS